MWENRRNNKEVAMSDINMDRREFIKDTGALAAGDT